MVLLANDFEEAPSSGTTIAAGNSGGGPGSSSAFDAVTIGAGATCQFSSAQAAHGTYSCKVQTGGSAAAAFVQWSAGSVGSQPTLYGRLYWYQTGNSVSGGTRIVQFYNNATYCGGIVMNPSGSIIGIQDAGYSFVQVWATAIPLSQWVRIEFAFTFSPSAGSATVNLYNTADSAGITEGHTVTSQNFGAASANIAQFGWAFSAASQPAVYLDDLQLNTTGFPGPVPLGTSAPAGAPAGAGTGPAPAAAAVATAGPGPGAGGGTAAVPAAGVRAAAGPALGGGVAAGGGGYTATYQATYPAAGTAVATTVPGQSAAGAAAGAGTAGPAAASFPAQATAPCPAGAGTASTPAHTSVSGLAPAAGAGAGTSPPAAARPASPESPPAAAGLGVAPPVAVSFNSTAAAGTAAGAGTALRPVGLPVLPPIFMGEARGTARPVPLPGGSQVAIAPPAGGQWTYLGTIGHVRDLKYSFVMPGGCDKMTCTVMVPASYRHQVFSTGWQVRVWRGGHIAWTGRLDEPSPSAAGWTVTAAGDGQRAQDFTSIWSGTWPDGQPDDAVNQAIARGLNWVNPGVGQPSWAWFGQQPDSGSQTIAQLLGLICTRGAGTWYVNSQPGGRLGPDLSLFPIPSVPDRLLLVTTPVARTLGAQVNRLVIRYQSAADNTATGQVAAYQVTTTANQPDIDAHQAAEAYLDLSSAGVMSAGAAQAAGNAVLAVYQQAAWANSFTAAPGQLMTINGQPVDPGCDQAGRVVKAVITDYGYGGDATPAQPVIFPVGGYEWDDQHLIATLTPFLSVDTSLSGLVSAQQLTLKPVTAVAPTSA